MLLSSVGFGTESTSVPAKSGMYHGWRFWELDAIGSPNLGLTKLPKVVIAGGGDGALQDTLRVLLKAPYENIRELVAALPQIPDDIRLSIADADDIATRSWLWATGGADDCPILDALHRRVEDASDVWWSRDHATIAAALDPLWRADVGVVLLVHGCTHFGRSFALNRFLLLLLERAAKDRTERELAAREDALVRGESRPPEVAPMFVRVSGHFLVSVDGGAGHTCSAVRPCPGRHEALFAVATCATPRGAAPPPSMTAPADLLILRGGVAAPASPLASSPISNRRQYLPDRPR
jgi:hypothetical protein